MQKIKNMAYNSYCACKKKCTALHQKKCVALHHYITWTWYHASKEMLPCIKKKKMPCIASALHASLPSKTVLQWRCSCNMKTTSTSQYEIMATNDAYTDQIKVRKSLQQCNQVPQNRRLLLSPGSETPISHYYMT